MRRILFEIPSAQTVAWVAAVIAVLFALYHAFRPPRKDRDGNREPFPVGSVAGGVIVAVIMVWGVALNKEFREDEVTLKSGKTVAGKIVKEGQEQIKLVRPEGVSTIRHKDVQEIRRDIPKGIPIYSYGFMMMAAFAAAIYLASVRARATGVDPNIILDLGLWAMISGILGARLFYVIQYSEQFKGKSFFEFLKVWEGGIVFYGGLIGAFFACLTYLVKNKISIRRIMDVVAPSLPLGVAFARFGCFLNGCCFGGRVDSDFSLGVRFGEGSHALYRHQALFGLDRSAELSLPIHPTQLYSSLTSFIIFLLVSLYFTLTRKKRVLSEVFLFFAVLYPIGRFVMEAFREDTDPVFGTGLTISQNVSILIFILALPFFIWTQVQKFRGIGVTTAYLSPGEPGGIGRASAREEEDEGGRAEQSKGSPGEGGKVEGPGGGGGTKKKKKKKK
ncbi:MAG: prolipoprotein diacylglyceryl transferase [Planctomycetota bacterium]|jgi:phosphatidylglycerol:prolipoprotein diacylglycerol transferase